MIFNVRKEKIMFDLAWKSILITAESRGTGRLVAVCVAVSFLA
jgi:hypothetical protein